MTKAGRQTDQTDTGKRSVIFNILNEYMLQINTFHNLGCILHKTLELTECIQD